MHSVMDNAMHLMQTINFARRKWRFEVYIFITPPQHAGHPQLAGKICTVR
jgi:hypothetical protein